jgi:hypothetical protein
MGGFHRSSGDVEVAAKAGERFERVGTILDESDVDGSHHIVVVECNELVCRVGSPTSRCDAANPLTESCGMACCGMVELAAETKLRLAVLAYDLERKVPVAVRIEPDQAVPETSALSSAGRWKRSVVEFGSALPMEPPCAPGRRHGVALVRDWNVAARRRLRVLASAMSRARKVVGRRLRSTSISSSMSSGHVASRTPGASASPWLVGPGFGGRIRKRFPNV